MSDPAQAVRAYIVGSFQHVPPSIVDDLASGSVSLLGIVRLLGEYLTSEEEDTRTRAVQLLSDLTCHFLDPQQANATKQPLANIFTVQAVRTLTSFFADKIADGVMISDNFVRSAQAPEVLPDTAPRARKNEAEQKTLQGSAMLVSALKALTVLCACKAPALVSERSAAASPLPVKGFGQEQAHAVADALFSHVIASNHPQGLRFIIYRLLDSLVAHHRDALKAYRSSAPASEEPAAAPTPAAATPMDVDDSADQSATAASGSNAAKSERCEGKDFLQGYVRMVQGEKDPRNLMVLFGVDKVLLTEWEMDHEMTEKFFDITFCYFPITFRPPPDDPYGITSDDLKVALRAAICASPAMAPLGYPLLLEKLSAAGGPAKLDTLRTLIAAMPVYGRAAALANAKKLWEGLKIEIFHVTDDETGDLAVDTLTTLLHVLYHGVDPPEGIAPKMVHDCLVELEEPGKSLAKAAIRVLSSLVRASASTAYLAVYGFMDQMIKMFADPEDLAQRTPILAGIGELLDALAKVYRYAELVKLDDGGSGKTSPGADEIGTGQLLPSTASERSYAGDNRPLDPFLSDLLNCLSNGLRSTSYRRSAMLVFSSAVSISILSSNGASNTKREGEEDLAIANKPLLDFDELSFLTREVASLLTSSIGDDVREEALCAIEVISNERTANTLAAVNPTAKVIEQVVLPVLLEKLPDRIEPFDDPEERTTGNAMDDTEAELDLAKSNIRRSLGALSRLCVAPFLFEAVVVKLFTKLELCCRPSARGGSGQEESNGVLGVTETSEEGEANTTVHAQLQALQEANVGYARGLIHTLQTMVDSKRLNGHRDLAKYAQTLPSRLVRLTLSGLETAGQRADELGIATHPAVVADTAALLGTFVKLLDVNRQRELLCSLNKTFVCGQATFVEEGSSADGPSLIPSSSTLAQTFAPFSPGSGSERPGFVLASKNAVALLSAAVVAAAPAAGVIILSPPSATENPKTKHDAALDSLSCLLEWALSVGSQSEPGLKSATVSAASRALQLNSACWSLAALANKFIDETQPAFLTLLDEFWGSYIKPGNPSALAAGVGKRRVALQVWMWLTRGLVVKSSKLAEAMLNRVLIEVFDNVAGKQGTSQLVAHPPNALAQGGESKSEASGDEWKFARAAARDLATIVAVGEDGIVTKEHGFTVRLLWKQKLFSFLLPRLLESYKAAATHGHENHVHGVNCSHGAGEVTVEARTIYLVSLAGMLPSLPSSMLVEQLEGLFPLLIQALTLPDSKARAAAANAITVASEVGKKMPAGQAKSFDPTSLIASHLATIVHKLLANVVPTTHTPASTRIAALRTLTSLAAKPDTDNQESPIADVGLMHHHLHPLRNVVLRHLATDRRGIDDKLRSVRNVAVDARDAWFAISDS